LACFLLENGPKMLKIEAKTGAKTTQFKGRFRVDFLILKALYSE